MRSRVFGRGRGAASPERRDSRPSARSARWSAPLLRSRRSYRPWSREWSEPCGLLRCLGSLGSSCPTRLNLLYFAAVNVPGESSLRLSIALLVRRRQPAASLSASGRHSPRGHADAARRSVSPLQSPARREDCLSAPDGLMYRDSEALCQAATRRTLTVSGWYCIHPKQKRLRR